MTDGMRKANKLSIKQFNYIECNALDWICSFKTTYEKEFGEVNASVYDCIQYKFDDFGRKWHFTFFFTQNRNLVTWEKYVESFQKEFTTRYTDSLFELKTSFDKGRESIHEYVAAQYKAFESFFPRLPPSVINVMIFAGLPRDIVPKFSSLSTCSKAELLEYASIADMSTESANWQSSVQVNADNNTHQPDHEHETTETNSANNTADLPDLEQQVETSRCDTSELQEDYFLDLSVNSLSELPVKKPTKKKTRFHKRNYCYNIFKL